MSYSGKIFGLGLSRTGTSSLNVALNMLGISTIHFPIDRTTYREMITGTYKLSILEKYDGITDITTVPIYPQLDHHYPGSKFILTTRDLQTWLKSIEKWFTNAKRLKRLQRNNLNGAMRRFIRAATYGIYQFNEERMTYVYNQHVESVKSYFKDRPESLLIMDIVGGDGWGKLCPFLGLEPPDSPFPNWQANKRKYHRLNPRRNIHFDEEPPVR